MRTNNMGNVINSIPTSVELCTGCSACASVCPVKAIKMTTDEEGFYSPVFDKSLCTNCGLCTKVCPINKFTFNESPSETYAVMVADENERLKCSSGGVASALSKYVISKGGYVCGCITQDFKTYHEIINKDNFELFDKLKGSKYVQSDIRGIFPRVKKLLKDNQLVLFIGTGCQVAGLKNYLIKPFNNLITIDFICHGVPSPKVLDDYISALKKKYPTASNYSTRDKVEGWQGAHEFNLFDADGNRLYRENGKYDTYISSFLAKCTTRQSCSTCKFANIQRAGDITVGDYWKIRKFNKNFDDKKGTSLVICNSERGRQLLSETKHLYKLFDTVPVEFAKSVQPNLVKARDSNKNRKFVFDMLKKGSNYFDFLDRKLFRVGILNYHFANNYGSVLIAYAMQSIVKKLGYIPENINYIGKKFNDNSVFDSFREQFISATESIESESELAKIQKKYKKIIVGSDQVWRFFDQSVYMLRFASGEKSLISYAASFGKNKYTAMDTSEAKQLLSRFSAISVRESKGVDICKKQFGLDAVSVLDPILLLAKDDYQKIINYYSPKNMDYEYVAFSFPSKSANTEDPSSALKKAFPDIQLQNISFNHSDDNQSNVGEWLNYISNAKFIVTNSCSVVMFSIIYRKNFVYILNSEDDAKRTLPLLDLLGVPLDRVVGDISDLNSSFLEKNMDYDSIYKVLESNKIKSFDYLKTSLGIAPKRLQEFSKIEEHKMSDSLNKTPSLSQNQKLNNCVCMGSSSYMLPALANMIIGIERHSPNLVDQYVVLHDASEVFDENDLKALSKLTNKVSFYPIDFDKRYKLPNLKILNGEHSYNKIIFAKYFVFDLLKYYKHVLWLDTDMLVVDDISEIFKIEGAAWRPVTFNAQKRCEYIKNFVTKNYPNAAMDDNLLPPPSGGLVYVTDTIENYEGLTDQCFNILYNCYRSAEKITRAMDELVVGIINYSHNLKARKLERKFNSVPESQDSSGAVIVHSFGKTKFWNSEERYLEYSEWGQNNNKWIHLGGRDIISGFTPNDCSTKSVGILNFHWANNFGAVLVPFSMLQVIKQLGYEPEIINYVPKEVPHSANYAKFRNKFLQPQSPLLSTHDDLVSYQDVYDKIVVGADQVWRLFNTSTFMLDFASGNKTLISYAPSFGGDSFTKLPNEKATELLNRFDAVSVREPSGIDICNNLGISAMHVIDPTMLLSAEDYEGIIDYFKPETLSHEYVAYSIINKANGDDLRNNLAKLSSSFNYPFKNILLSLNSKSANTVGGWLNDIKNAKFVITDSFHATVFSIIYRKNFVCLVTQANGAARIPSLLRMFGIDDRERIVDSLSKVSPEIMKKDIDYNKVAEKIHYHSERSMLFLKNALAKKMTYKEKIN